MLLRYRRYDKSGMEVDQCRTKGAEFGVPSANLKILRAVNIDHLKRSWFYTYSCSYGVHNVAPSTLMILASVGDDNRKIWVLV